MEERISLNARSPRVDLEFDIRRDGRMYSIPKVNHQSDNGFGKTNMSYVEKQYTDHVSSRLYFFTDLLN